MSNASSTANRLGIFSCAGIEIEYMVVDRDTFDVKPVVMQLFENAGYAGASDVDRGKFTWSNELVAHVAELKLSKPLASLNGVAEGFQNELTQINALLEPLNARILPTGMHPWMNPAEETMLWPLESVEIYDMYDKLFGCHQHGWANLQSMHINLPFDGDEEFCRLHSAIRMILPILPGLSASSPFCDGKFSGTFDMRLYSYGRSCSKIPACSGQMIPESYQTEAEYTARILHPMYEALKPYDTEDVLCEEYSNARGAIARFSRGSIEIRLIDTQESPRMDLAIANLVIRAVKELADGKRFSLEQQLEFDQQALVRLYKDAVHQADMTVCPNPEFLSAMGITDANYARVGELWQAILERVWPEDEETELRADAEWLIRHGTLSRRILNRAGISPTHAALKRVYEDLADCAQAGQRYGW